MRRTRLPPQPPLGMIPEEMRRGITTLGACVDALEAFEPSKASEVELTTLEHPTPKLMRKGGVLSGNRELLEYKCSGVMKSGQLQTTEGRGGMRI